MNVGASQKIFVEDKPVQFVFVGENLIFSDESIFSPVALSLPMPYTRFKSGSTPQDLPPGVTQTAAGNGVNLTGYNDTSTATYQVFFNTGNTGFPTNAKVLRARYVVSSIQTGTNVQLGIGFGAFASAVSLIQVAQSGALVRTTQQTAVTIAGANALFAITAGTTIDVFVERTGVSSVNVYVASGGNVSAKYSFTGVDLTGSLLIAMRGSATVNVNLATTGYLRTTAIPSVKSVKWKYNPAVAPYLIQKFTTVADTDTVNGSAANGYVSGNTGLTYNPYTQEYYVACYNYTASARIFVYKREDMTPYVASPPIMPTPRRIIDVTAFIDHIQGLAYDTVEGYIYVYGTIKGSAGGNGDRTIICIDVFGNKVKPDWTGMASGEAGDISIYQKKLYLKPNNVVTCYIYDLAAKSLIDSFTTYTSGEGLAVSDAGIYICGGSDIRLYSHAAGHAQLNTYPNPSYNGEVEGMFIHPADGRLVKNADTFLHGVQTNGNETSELNISGEYGQNFQSPGMHLWDRWTFEGSLKPFGFELQGTGKAISPVIDMQSFTDYLINDPVVEVNGRTVTFEYQNSSVAPTGTLLTDQTSSVYLNWGNTVPGAWSSTKSANRYQRLRMTVS